MSKNQGPPIPAPRDSAAGCLVRLAWMLLGNFALALSAIFIALNAGASLCLADAVFWAAAASMVGIRYLDIARFRGQTVMSEPATMAHWRRYVVVLPAVSLGVWGLAHGVAYLSR